MIKIIIILLNFAINCRFLSDTRVIALVQAGMQANRLASAIDCAGNITNFTENHASKSFFFSQDSKDMCSLIFVCHKTDVSGKHPIRENNTYRA